MDGLANLGEAELGEVWFPEAKASASKFGYGVGDEPEKHPPLAETSIADALLQTLSADAPAFVPGSALALGGLSAEAPVSRKSSKKSLTLDQRYTNNSDVSTIDGESESDEDKAVTQATT